MLSPNCTSTTPIELYVVLKLSLHMHNLGLAVSWGVELTDNA